MQRGASVIRGGLASAGFRGSPARTTRSFIRGGSSRSHIASVMRAAVSETTGEAMPAETEKEWTKRDLRHTSAVVICPPTSTWEPIQRIRAVNDKSYTRWMPHINLLYPFLLDDGEEATATSIEPRRRRGRRCETSSRSPSPFERSDTSHTPRAARFGFTRAATERRRTMDGTQVRRFWRLPIADSLPPVSDGVMATQAALERAFPFANDLSTISPAGFTPHLSVGQYDDKETASEALESDECDVGADDVRGGRGVHHIPRGSRRAVRVQGEGAARGAAGASAGGVWRRGDGGDAETDWWTEVYSPPPPPEGARCLRPKPKRRWRGKKRGGGRGGRGRGDPGA